MKFKMAQQDDACDIKHLDAGDYCILHRDIKNSNAKVYWVTDEITYSNGDEKTSVTCVSDDGEVLNIEYGTQVIQVIPVEVKTIDGEPYLFFNFVYETEPVAEES